MIKAGSVGGEGWRGSGPSPSPHHRQPTTKSTGFKSPLSTCCKSSTSQISFTFSIFISCYVCACIRWHAVVGVGGKIERKLSAEDVWQETDFQKLSRDGVPHPPLFVNMAENTSHKQTVKPDITLYQNEAIIERHSLVTQSHVCGNIQLLLCLL